MESSESLSCHRHDDDRRGTMNTRAVGPLLHSAASRFLEREHELLIAGARSGAIAGERFDTRNPATGQVIASVAKAGGEDIDCAVRAARDAFESAEWRGMSAAARGRLLLRYAD